MKEYGGVDVYIHISVVGIATGYGMDDRRGQSSSPGRVKNILSSTSSKPALGSTQPIKWEPGSLSPEVKRPGREADHSPPASAEVKNMWFILELSNTISVNLSRWTFSGNGFEKRNVP
jgi:hypothetical protein